MLLKGGLGVDLPKRCANKSARLSLAAPMIHGRDVRMARTSAQDLVRGLSGNRQHGSTDPGHQLQGVGGDADENRWPPRLLDAENGIAGRGRRYHRVVIDEAAFTKDGDNKTKGSMMEIWEKSIKPTLYDHGDEVLVCSNTAGKNSENFFYNICEDRQYGFGTFHATTMDNPVLPKRLQNETLEDGIKRRAGLLEGLRTGNDPLVYAQEHLAEFIDWAGVGFFARENLLVNNAPVPFPTRCECVFAVIDTASKTGSQHDGTAVTFFALERHGAAYPLMILDWHIAQIEGALLETWLPTVFTRLEELAKQCGREQALSEQ
jgi:hypothetical protein